MIWYRRGSRRGGAPSGTVLPEKRPAVARVAGVAVLPEALRPGIPTGCSRPRSFMPAYDGASRRKFPPRDFPKRPRRGVSESWRFRWRGPAGSLAFALAQGAAASSGGMRSAVTGLAKR